MIIEETGLIVDIPEPNTKSVNPKTFRGLIGLKTLVYLPDKNTFGSPSYSFEWPGRMPMEARCSRCKSGIQPGCSCGLYASLLPEVSIGNYARTDNHVIGLMEGWGRTRMGKNGFASQYGRIVGMVNLDRNGNSVQYDTSRKTPMLISNYAAMAFFGVQMFSKAEADIIMVMNWMRLEKLHNIPVHRQLSEVAKLLKGKSCKQK